MGIVTRRRELQTPVRPRPDMGHRAHVRMFLDVAIVLTVEMCLKLLPVVYSLFLEFGIWRH